MKRLVLILGVLFLLIATISKSQSIKFVRVLSSIDQDIPRGFLTCKNGCSVIFALGKHRISDGPGWFLYNIDANGDTTMVDTLSSQTSGSFTIMLRSGDKVLLRSIHKEVVPGQPSRANGNRISNYNFRTKHLFWERVNFNNALSKWGYFGFREMGYFLTPNNTIKMVSSRYGYPNVNDLAHPFIQEFDTSGNLLNEVDFILPTGEYCAARSASKQTNGDFVLALETGFGTTDTYLAQWIDGPTNTVYKRKLTPISFRNQFSDNYLKIEVIKPGDKYLVYARGLAHNRVNGQDVYEEYTYLTDSSLSLQNAYWVKPGNAFTHAKALDDGNIMGIINSPGGAIVEKWNTQTGQRIWQTFVPHGYPNPTENLTLSFDIDDSGNVYLAGQVGFSPTNMADIWIARVNNVGIEWNAWATGPQGINDTQKPSLSLFAYPNPTSGKFRLKGYKEEEGLTLRLFSNSGKEVWRGAPSPEGEVDISNLSPGLYHVEALTTSGKRWSTRVVRE